MDRSSAEVAELAAARRTRRRAPRGRGCAGRRTARARQPGGDGGVDDPASSPVEARLAAPVSARRSDSPSEIPATPRAPSDLVGGLDAGGRLDQAVDRKRKLGNGSSAWRPWGRRRRPARGPATASRSALVARVDANVRRLLARSGRTAPRGWLAPPPCAPAQPRPRGRRSRHAPPTRTPSRRGPGRSAGT